MAQRLGLRASAVRYYEERGLVTPASRHAGRWWYSPVEIRRLAIIRFWQQSALMSLDEIGEILEGNTTTRNWSRIVEGRTAELGIQIERMDTARAFDPDPDRLSSRASWQPPWPKCHPRWSP